MLGGNFMGDSIESSKNRKAAILEKSRKVNQDEGVDYAKNQGRRIGMHALGGMSLALAAFSFFTNQASTINALVAAIFAFSCGEMLAHYLFTKNMLHLAGAVLFALLSFSQVYFFVTAVLGW